MTARSRHQLSHDLVAAGVVISAGEGDNLVTTCTRGPLNPDLRQEMIERKPEILAWLRTLPAHCCVPTLCMTLGRCPRALAGEQCRTVVENICAEHPIDTQEVA